ncbi:MAG: phospholipid carrier-dependent glycosyltransferase [Demequinaceae bacterium]|nr:phospholipid carrier-dependent glycosyltransferase [Demequinaceae bacterium]
MLLDRLYRFRLALMLSSVGALAGILRFVGLSQPKTLVFDELYYARGAYSLLHQGYEGWWGGESQDFANGDFSGLEVRADKVVHPPLGKWMIAAGIKLFGPGPFGWRFSAALIGTVTVVLVALIAYHLFRSVVWGGVAGIFLAVDGQHLVLSRTALLDIFLTFFVVVAFGFLLLDRRRNKRRLEERATLGRERLGLADTVPLPKSGPRGGIRWWRLAAIVTLGLATGVKWSGLYFAVAFLALSIAWEAVDRWKLNLDVFTPRAFFARLTVPVAVTTMVLLPLTYVGSYSSWFVSDSSYMRHWAALHEDEGIQWLPETPRSFVAYQQEIYRFHTTLTFSNGVDHSYAARPWGFLLQIRPTAFYWEDVPAGEGDPPSDERYVAETIALGNPLLWWAGAVAFFYALARLIRRGDLLAGAVIIGTLGGWVPWLFYPDRVMFTFYSVAFSPWVMLTLVWALRRIAQPPHLKGGWSRRGSLCVGGFIALALLLSGFYLPMWNGQWIPYDYWHQHIIDVGGVADWNWI